MSENKSKKRGRLIVFEGLDKSGKSTQSKLLADHLSSNAKLVKFPDRSEPATGKIIDDYLKGKIKLTPQAAHLLFVANRFQVMADIEKSLSEGIDIITDRYSYSGTAYAVARGLDVEWVMSPEIGLLQPDIVFCFLPRTDDILRMCMKSVDAKEREITENVEMQLKALEVFSGLGKDYHDDDSITPEPIPKKWVYMIYDRHVDATPDDISKNITETHRTILSHIEKI